MLPKQLPEIPQHVPISRIDRPVLLGRHVFSFQRVQYVHLFNRRIRFRYRQSVALPSTRFALVLFEQKNVLRVPSAVEFAGDGAPGDAATDDNDDFIFLFFVTLRRILCCSFLVIFQKGERVSLSHFPYDDEEEISSFSMRTL